MHETTSTQSNFQVAVSLQGEEVILKTKGKKSFRERKVERNYIVTIVIMMMELTL